MIIIGIFLRDANCIEFSNVKGTRSIVPGAYIVEFSRSLTRSQINNHV